MVIRVSDSQPRYSRFEYYRCCYQRNKNSFTRRCPNSLNCVNEYWARDCLYGCISRGDYSVTECFQKRGDGVRFKRFAGECVCVRACVRALFDWFVRSFVRVRAFVRAFVRSFVCRLVGWLVSSFVCLCMRACVRPYNTPQTSN